jgi:hypothetical protein
MKNSYHIVLEWCTLQLLGAFPGDVVILIDYFVVIVRVWQVGNMFLGVGGNFGAAT